MASETLQIIKQKAEELYSIRKEIEAIEEATKLQTSDLKIKKEQIQTYLLEALSEEGLSSIKTESGDSFIKAKKSGIEIIDETKALSWAIENRCVNINKIALASKLKNIEELPEGIKSVETEYISIRKAKEDKTNE